MHSFDTITAEAMMRAGSAKWTAFPDTIGMWLAEMDFGIARELEDFLCAQARGGSLGYLPQHEEREIIRASADYLQDVYDWTPRVERMHLIPDVLTALRMTIELFTPAGSPVVVPTPAYMPFLTIPREFGREVIEVPSLLGDDGVWRCDYEGLEAAFAGGARMMILCNPWNPVGRCLTREELERLDRLVERYDVRVFEDGIHFPLVFDGSETVAFASVSENAAAHTVSAVAASKGWNIPGLKCAQLIFNNDDDNAVFKPVASRFTGATSTIGARAARVCYEDARQWNEDVCRYLAGNRDIVSERVAAWDGVRMGAVEGTYIAFLDFSELAERGVFGEKTAAEWIRENAGVSLTAGESCGRGYKNWARMTFANSRPVLEDALTRIETAQQGLPS